MGRRIALVATAIVLFAALGAAREAGRPPFVTVYFGCTTPPNIVDGSSKVVEELRQLFSERGVFRSSMTVVENSAEADILIEIAVYDKATDGPNGGAVAETKATLHFGRYTTEMLGHSNPFTPQDSAEPLARRIRQWVKDNETQILATRPR